MGGKIRVGSIVLRVDDFQRQMKFWAAALDYVPREDPSDDPSCCGRGRAKAQI